jgi:hypothetical protein
MRLRPLSLCILPLVLAACQGEKEPAEASTAQGEILQGSASDAMLPLDTVRSQAPLAPIEVASGKPGKAKEGGAAAEEDASEGAEPATAESAAPAASPSIAAAAEQ